MAEPARHRQRLMKLPREIFGATRFRSRSGIELALHAASYVKKIWPSGKKSDHGGLEEVKCCCPERLDVSIAEEDEALQVGSG